MQINVDYNILMTNTPDILQKIIAQKVMDIAADQREISASAVQQQAQQIKTTSQFYENLKYKITHKQPAVIAEIKKASPSKGVLREDFHPVEIAKNYERAGATCLSILTDREFFKGSDTYVSEVTRVTTLPILRKEFIIDPYQIYQAKVIGASAILLIAAILDVAQMREFTALASELGMDTLIEVHNKAELDKVLMVDPDMIGINNRNLRDFSVSLATTTELLEYTGDKLIITESGILSRADVAHMNAHGIYGFLVGEALMRQENIEYAYTQLFG